MAKLPTLDETLASEVKQEIAGRYFGFRKLIEEDSMDLAQKIREYSFILQKRISFDLIRLYILFRDEERIRRFLALAGLHEELFYDPYLVESPTIARRVFECQRFRGVTQARRFTNYVFDCYEGLVFHVGQYRMKLEELEDEQGMIAEEIREFYRQNDISAILGFLKHLGDEQATGAMQGGMETGLAEGLAEKLKISIPLPIEQMLPVIPALASLDSVRHELKKLSKEAYRHLPEDLRALFVRNSTPCPQRDNMVS